MLNFLKRIRRNLLAEGKSEKYLIYAAGEILLVVIGILIALQINNWNDHRKIQTLKQSYYKQLLSDLESDKEYADSTISILSSQIQKHEDYKRAFEEPNLGIQRAIDKLTASTGPTLSMQFKTSTINSLITTGDIKLFDIELRDDLAKYAASKNQTETLHAYNSSLAGGMAQKILMTAGAPDLLMRLSNQKELTEFLAPAIQKEDAFVILEAYLWQRSTGNKNTISGLNKLKKNADKLKAILKSRIAD